MSQSLWLTPDGVFSTQIGSIFITKGLFCHLASECWKEIERKIHFECFYLCCMMLDRSRCSSFVLLYSFAGWASLSKACMFITPIRGQFCLCTQHAYSSIMQKMKMDYLPVSMLPKVLRRQSETLEPSVNHIYVMTISHINKINKR